LHFAHAIPIFSPVTLKCGRFPQGHFLYDISI